MNNILKTIALSAAVILGAAACSKWTEQEPVDFNYLTLEDKNPELYAAYMQSIRDYHATEHQVLIARFDNKASAPAGRADHITCLPDSVDYVVLNNYEIINENTMKEVAEIREKKAVSTLIALDYALLDKEYKAYLETLPEETPEETPEVAEETEGETEPAVDPRNQWFADKASAFVAAAKQYGLDGIMVSYTGTGLLSLKEDEKAAVQAFQEAFFAPILSYVAETGKMFFYEGNPTTLIAPQDVLAQATYIVVPAEDVTTIVGFNFAVMMSMGAGIPNDRFVIGVTALNVTDETATDGLFSGDITAIEGAGRWAVTPTSDYTKAGVCVNHAQYDYYNMQNVYSGINAAIATMNPSPIK
jgi:hypothetical protein